MKKYYINNIKFTITGITNPTILDVCGLLEYNIPRFCYHPKLSVAGNCRMCLVDVEGNQKPVASCSMPLMASMRIYTNTARVKKAREGVLEFLLANHPLDCPICDQGGECDLQDQALIFGGDRGRFYENKRAVEDKHCGPLIKTLMTRCIHCTRCIRFYTEIAGSNAFGTTGRGLHMEIGTYISNLLSSELSGNIVDLCPVGALTSKPYAFTARSWELTSIESINILDTLCSKIRIDIKGNKIMRILPVIGKNSTESWISDKARFAYDGIQSQRLLNPMIFKNSLFIKVTWLHSFIFMTYLLKNILYYLKDNIKIPVLFNNMCENLVDIEALFALKHLFTSCGYNITNKTNNASLRSNYLFNTCIKKLKKADLILLVGVNPRLESPLINLELRKNFLKYKGLIFSIGYSTNLTYNIQHLGNSTAILLKLFKGKHWLAQYLKKSKMPLIIKNSSQDNLKLFQLLFSLKNSITTKVSYECLNTITTNVGLLNSTDLNITLQPAHTNLYYSNIANYFIVNINYLISAPSGKIRVNNKNLLSIYQGHHGDKTIITNDIILPTTTYLEKIGTYTNIFGTFSQTSCATYPLSNLRADWKITSVFNEFLKILLFFKSNLTMSNYLSNNQKCNQINKNKNSLKLMTNLAQIKKNSIVQLPNKVYLPTIDNFYQSDTISKASYTMSLCTQQLGKRKKSFNLEYK